MWKQPLSFSGLGKRSSPGGQMERPRQEYLVLVFILSFSLSTPRKFKPWLQRVFSYQGQEMIWADAKFNCLTTYSTGKHRLAIARNTSEVKMLSHVCNELTDNQFNEGKCFVGLRKKDSAWYRADGEENSLPLQSGSELDYACAVVYQDNLHIHPCTDETAYICERYVLVLVKEKKTWEEALFHCRDLGVNKGKFDLLSLHTQADLSYAQEEVVHAQTEEVWVGLRWLAGRLLWMDGEEVMVSECPADGTHCGSLSGQGLHVRSCMERRNFFCLRLKNVK